MRANAASGAARPVIVVAFRGLPLAREFKLTDRVQKPSPPLLGEVNPPYLLAGIDHKGIGRQGLNNVARIDLSPRGRLVFQTVS